MPFLLVVAVKEEMSADFNRGSDLPACRLALSHNRHGKKRQPDSYVRLDHGTVVVSAHNWPQRKSLLVLLSAFSPSTLLLCTNHEDFELGVRGKSHHSSWAVVLDNYNPYLQGA